ncbi:MAG: hypothetical protein ABI678_26580, partial [Kofleriaceae bacterium]
MRSSTALIFAVVTALGSRAFAHPDANPAPDDKSGVRPARSTAAGGAEVDDKVLTAQTWTLSDIKAACPHPGDLRALSDM